MLVPTNVRGGGHDFSAQGTGQAFGTTYHMFQASGLRQNDVRTLQVSGLVAAGQVSDLDVRALAALAAVLALLGALTLGLYLRRGDLSLALLLDRKATSGKSPASATSGARSATLPRMDSRTPQACGQHSEEHEALLRELLVLEQDRAAGRLGDEQFRLRSGEVRAALRALLAEEDLLATQMAHAPGDPTTAEAPLTLGGGR